MSIFNLFRGSNINEHLKTYQQTEGAILLDVRTPEEYRSGRIPNSKNIPVENISTISSTIPNKDTPLFVYCLSGARSHQACLYLKNNGYTKVTNIGGINSYNGPIER